MTSIDLIRVKLLVSDEFILINNELFRSELFLDERTDNIIIMVLTNGKSTLVRDSVHGQYHHHITDVVIRAKPYTNLISCSISLFSFRDVILRTYHILNFLHELDCNN